MGNFLEPLEPRRLMAAGDLDPTFGSGGVATLRGASGKGYSGSDSSTYANPRQIAVDSVGRTLVLSSRIDHPMRDPKDFLDLQRLTADGRPDSRFAIGTRGMMTVPIQYIGGHDTAKILVDAKDRITVLAGWTLYYFTSSGKPDRSRGDRGHVDLSDDPFFYPEDMASSPDGGVTISGTVEGLKPERFVRVKGVSADGELATLLDAPPITSTPQGATITQVETSQSSLRALPDGTTVVQTDLHSSYADGSQMFKLTAAGTLDRTYGKNGRRNLFGVSPTGLIDDGTAVWDDGNRFYTIDANGRDAGRIADFNSDFSPDAFFREPDGRLLALDDYGGTLRRYNADYTRDRTFDARYSITGAEAVAISRSGEILFATTGPSHREEVDDGNGLYVTTVRNGSDNRFDVRRVFGM